MCYIHNGDPTNDANCSSVYKPHSQNVDCFGVNPESVNVCGSYSLLFPRPFPICIGCLSSLLFRKNRHVHVCLHLCMSAQIQLNDDSFMTSGYWSTDNYLSLMVTSCQMIIASSTESYTPSRQEEQKAEGQKRHASGDFLLLKSSLGSFIQ